MNKQLIIITSAGMLIGFAEALIYYNMGKKKENGTFRYSIPKGKELGTTILAVLITSVLTAAISSGIEKMAKKPELVLVT